MADSVGKGHASSPPDAYDGGHRRQQQHAGHGLLHEPSHAFKGNWASAPTATSDQASGLLQQGAEQTACSPAWNGN
jgi:hypothetical protein